MRGLKFISQAAIIIWNKIKALYYKNRLDANLTEIWIGTRSTLGFEEWCKAHNMPTWEYRRQELIEQGKLNDLTNGQA